MPPRNAESTSITLLNQLCVQSADGLAWQEFVARYRPRIYTHCLSCGLQPADAEDVAQSVLLRLVKRLPQFRYEPRQSFRAWLKAVTRNVVVDFLDERKGQQGSGDTAVVRLLETQKNRESLARQVEEEFDQELLDAALVCVREQVPGQQWEAFRLTALEGLSGAEAGQRLGMLVATVYSARSKVQKLLRAEVERLGSPPAPG